MAYNFVHTHNSLSISRCVKYPVMMIMKMLLLVFRTITNVWMLSKGVNGTQTCI